MGDQKRVVVIMSQQRYRMEEPSHEVVTTVGSDGCQATSRTMSVCPVRRCCTCPDNKSYMYAEPSLEPVQTN